MNKIKLIIFFAIYFISVVNLNAQTSQNSFKYSANADEFVLAKRQNVLSSDSGSYSYSFEKTIGFTIGTEIVYRPIKIIIQETLLDKDGNPYTAYKTTYQNIETYDTYIKVMGLTADDNLEQKYRKTYQAIQTIIALQTEAMQNDNILSIGIINDYNEISIASSNPEDVYNNISDYVTWIINNAPTNNSNYQVTSLTLNNNINGILDNLPVNENSNSNSKPSVFLVYKINQNNKKTLLTKSELYVSYKVNHKFTNATYTNSISTTDLSNTLYVDQTIIGSGGQRFLNTRQEYDIKTTASIIGSRKFRRWQLDNSKFKKKSVFFSDINIIEYQAQFDVFNTLQITNSSIEGTTPSFTFTDPWLYENDGETQLNEAKTYSGNQNFQVFTNTNSINEIQASQPTYVLNKGAVTGSNGIEYFVLGESATGATFHPAQSDEESIVTFSGNATINRTYKAKNHSSLNTVVSLDHRRKVVSSYDKVYRTYLSGLNELGGERLWVQSRPISSRIWSNEFEIPLQDEMVNTFLSTGYINSAIAYSNGSVWLVAEAIYENLPNPSPVYYSLIAIRIDNFGEANQSLHHTIIATKSGSPFHSYAIGGFNQPGSSVSKITIAYMDDSPSNNLKLAVAFMDNNTNENTVQHTSSNFSLWTTINLSDLDVAVNGNYIGLSANANGSVLFAEAVQQVYGAFYWNSGATQLIYGSGFSNLGTGASLTKWGNSSAFKIAYNASMVVNGSTHYGIAYKNIGSTATNTAVSFNYGSGTLKKAVELSRTDVDLDVNSDGNIVFTYWVDTATNDYLEQRKVMYGGAYSYVVQTIPLTTINRSLATTSPNSLILGTYETLNNGLYKLNEMQNPIVAKGKEPAANYFDELVVIAEPSKITEDVRLSFIAGLHIGKTQIRTYAVEDSLNAMALSDWFEWHGEPLHLDFHAYKKNQVAYNLAIVDSNGVVLQSWKPNAKASQELFDLTNTPTKNDFSQLVLTSKSIKNAYEKVRLVAIPLEENSNLYIIGTAIASTNSADNKLASIVELHSIEDELDFNLIHAYPNPFNPTTTLRFKLETSSKISIRVYDSLGRLVSELLRGEKEAGVHSVVFDAKGLASGAYFIRMQYTNAKGSVQMQTKAITLVK